MEIVVAQSWVNGNLVGAPDRSFAVPDLPVILIVSVIDDVTAEGDKRRIGLGDCLNERLAHGWVRRLRVLRIMEARIPIGDKVKGRTDLELQLHRFGFRRWLVLRLRTVAGHAAEKQNGDQQSLEAFHLCPTTSTSN